MASGVSMQVSSGPCPQNPSLVPSHLFALSLLAPTWGGNGALAKPARPIKASTPGEKARSLNDGLPDYPPLFCIRGTSPTYHPILAKGDPWGSRVGA